MLKQIVSPSVRFLRATSRPFHHSSILLNPLSGAHLKKHDQKDLNILAKRVRAISGEENVSCSESVRSHHGQDAGSHLGRKPDIVVYPMSTQEVSEICKLCYQDSIPIIAHGTGTGLEGGTSALFGGICLDLTKMDEIIEYHPFDFDVSVRPGVTRESLNHYLKDDGLWFPVDPGANSSICGMCATSASGTNAMKYGTMKENCINLEVVLSNGRIIHTNGEGKRPRKNSAGYNLTNLMVGSEGTLGIITKATVRLHAIPEAIASAVVTFPSVEQATNTVVAILQSSAPVARMEFLDEASIKICNGYSQMGLEEKPTLFLEFHGSDSGLKEQSSVVAEIADQNGGSNFQWATKMEDRQKLWSARYNLHWAVKSTRPGTRSVDTDVCVPISKLPEMIKATRDDFQEAGINAPIFGHVGDGNFHTMMLFDPDNIHELQLCKSLAKRMGHRAISHGGTCTGEHGIGLGKIELMEEMYGPDTIRVMADIKKKVFDPKGIMNPGKVLRLQY